MAAMVMGVAGWTGTVLLVAAYAAVTSRRMRVTGVAYQLVNVVGGVLLLMNTAYHGAWPSTALNVVWFGIGAVGVLGAVARGDRDHPVSSPPECPAPAADPPG